MDTFSTQIQNVRKNINMIKYLLRCIITILSMKLKIYIDDALIFTRVTLLVKPKKDNTVPPKRSTIHKWKKQSPPLTTSRL
jgi:hypothetical protein